MRSPDLWRVGGCGVNCRGVRVGYLNLLEDRGLVVSTEHSANRASSVSAAIPKPDGLADVDRRGAETAEAEHLPRMGARSCSLLTGGRDSDAGAASIAAGVRVGYLNLLDDRLLVVSTEHSANTA
jgi:hypothetical protein